MRPLRLTLYAVLLLGLAACSGSNSPTAPTLTSGMPATNIVVDGASGGSGEHSPTSGSSENGSTAADRKDHHDGSKAENGDDREGDDHEGRQRGLSARITARPTSIQAGQTSTLQWSTSNATSVMLNGVSVGGDGTETVSPAATTVYTLVASNATGTRTATATVTVGGTPPPPGNPTASLTANPTTMASGQSSMLTWTTTNATSATLDGTAVALNGSQSVSPAATHTYTLVATGAGGSATANATVTVTATPPPPPSLTYTRDIQPILAASCTSCHSAARAAAGVDLSSYAAVLQIVTPGSANSRLVTSTQPGGSMAGFLSTQAAATILSWVVSSGAAQ